MQLSAFAIRVQAQLDASRALLASAPRVELSPAARALLACADHMPKAQRGASCAPLLICVALAIVLGAGVAHMASGAIDTLTHALTLRP